MNDAETIIECVNRNFFLTIVASKPFVPKRAAIKNSREANKKRVIPSSARRQHKHTKQRRRVFISFELPVCVGTHVGKKTTEMAYML